MSVEQLKFKKEFELDGQPRVNYLRAHYNGKGIINISITAGKVDGVEKVNRFKLDRNQAHLLMLYLQEHLK